MPEMNAPARPASAEQPKPQAPPSTTALLESASKLIQVVAVVVGVVVSVMSFNAAREKEASAREFESKRYFDQRGDEAQRRQAEAAKPFLELRQKLYLEAVQAAGVLANPEDHAEDQVKKARTRFRQLYVAELSLVESKEVEQSMVALAAAVDTKPMTMTGQQRAAYDLAHALRDSLVKSWNFKESVVDNPGRRSAL